MVPLKEEVVMNFGCHCHSEMNHFSNRDFPLLRNQAGSRGCERSFSVQVSCVRWAGYFGVIRDTPTAVPSCVVMGIRQ